MKNMVCHVIKIVLKRNKSIATDLMSSRKLIASYEPLSDDADCDKQIIIRNKNKKANMVSTLINCHDVPKGFVAVYVGSEERRFLIPTTFLSVPDFKIVMERAAEEFGYEQLGGLRIPCNEQDFEQLLETCLSACKVKIKSY